MTLLLLQLIGKIYLHYKHIDWAAVALEKSVIPYLSAPESSVKPDAETMLLLAGSNKKSRHIRNGYFNFFVFSSHSNFHARDERNVLPKINRV